MQVKKQQLEPDREQWTGSKSGREYIKAMHCHLAYLIYMQSTSYEVPGWMKQKLESRLTGETAVVTGLAKIQFSFQSQRKAMLKNTQTIIQLDSFHMLVRLCSKPFKLGFSNI